MDREIHIIIFFIAILIFGVVGLVMITDDSIDGEVQKEDKISKDISGEYIDTSDWRIYESEEFAIEVKYPLDWEFNLTDGTVFYPVNCVRDKNDNCIGRISMAVFPQPTENNDDVYLQSRCAGAQKISLRFISSDVWICESQLSSEFLVKKGFDKKREYHFFDGRGNVIQIDVMYKNGDDISIEEEMIQTIKIQAKN